MRDTIMSSALRSDGVSPESASPSTSRLAADTRSAARRPEAGLLWTDAWYLAGIAIAALLVVDPMQWELAGNTLARGGEPHGHGAAVAAMPACDVAGILEAVDEPDGPGGREPEHLAEPVD